MQPVVSQRIFDQPTGFSGAQVLEIVELILHGILNAPTEGRSK
jgi:hypothetical protein